MANAKVALLRYCLTDAGWRRLRVTAVRKGRGREERVDTPKGTKLLEKGNYQLRWYQGSQARFKGVGKISRKRSLRRGCWNASAFSKEIIDL